MWQHCPVQACWCTRTDRLPLDFAAHECACSAISGVINMTEDHSALNLGEIQRQFDMYFTSYCQEKQLTDLPTFVEVGKKYLGRLNDLSMRLNKMLTDGWKIADGSTTHIIPIPGLPEWTIHHTSDMILKSPDGTTTLASIYLGKIVRYSERRQVTRSMDNMLNCLVKENNPNVRIQTIILTSDNVKHFQSSLDLQDLDLALSYVKAVIRALQSKAVTHARICNLNCANCPVVDMCDDPTAYKKLITQEDIIS